MQVEVQSRMSNGSQQPASGLASMATYKDMHNEQTTDNNKGGDNKMQGLDNSDVDEAGWSSGFEDSDDDMFGGPF